MSPEIPFTTSSGPGTEEPLLVVTVNVDGAFARPEGVEFPDGLLREVLDFCYRSRRKKPAIMDLLIADDVVMTRLNRRHLGHDGPTDVLAFADGEMEEGRLRLGDVAVGASVALREAESRKIPFEQELVFYALHGLLHLLGMEDGSDAERAGMHRIQARAMKDFGMAIADGLADA